MHLESSNFTVILTHGQSSVMYHNPMPFGWVWFLSLLGGKYSLHTWSLGSRSIGGSLFLENFIAEAVPWLDWSKGDGLRHVPMLLDYSVVLCLQQAVLLFKDSCTILLTWSGAIFAQYKTNHWVPFKQLIFHLTQHWVMSKPIPEQRRAYTSITNKLFGTKIRQKWRKSIGIVIILEV